MMHAYFNPENIQEPVQNQNKIGTIQACSSLFTGQPCQNEMQSVNSKYTDANIITYLSTEIL